MKYLLILCLALASCAEPTYSGKIDGKSMYKGYPTVTVWIASVQLDYGSTMVCVVSQDVYDNLKIGDQMVLNGKECNRFKEHLSINDLQASNK